MKLLRKVDVENLRKNSFLEGEPNRKVMVKLFNPYGAGTWWLHSYADYEEDIVWGWAMINCDTPEYGTISLKELRSLKFLGQPQIERDKYFKPCTVDDVFKRSIR